MSTIGEWQPIESCPNDGFFLVHEDGAIRTMFRFEGRWEWPGVPILIDGIGNRLVSRETEQAGLGKLELSDCIYEPTHWMGLPDTP